MGYTSIVGNEAGQTNGATMSIDRSEAARALAKAIAYKNCGKDAQAEHWAEKLVILLECHSILAAADCQPEVS
jgi:hypothetical protein